MRLRSGKEECRVEGASRPFSCCLLGLAFACLLPSFGERANLLPLPPPPCRPLPGDAGEATLERLDKLRHSSGGLRTSAIRRNMQKIMQARGGVALCHGCCEWRRICLRQRPGMASSSD